MLGFEFLHAGNQGLHALHGECVVEGGAEAADAAVALDAYHAAGGGEVEELLLELGVVGIHDEAYVHDGTVLLGHGAHEELVAVDLGIELGCLLEVELLECGHAALLLVVTQGLKCGEDGEHRRGVEHGTLLDVGAVVEHGGNLTAYVAEQVFLDDDEGDAGGGEVLLGATVDEAVLGGVEHAAEDVGAHVADHGHGAVVVAADLGAVDGVVGGEVEVVDVGGDGEVLRDIVVVGSLGGSHYVNFAEELGLLDGLVGPCAGVYVCGLLFEQVEGDHSELGACAAAEEEHVVALGKLEKLLDQRGGLVDHCLELLAAVADLEQAQACAGEVDYGVCRILDGVGRQDAGACIEIVLFHDCLSRLGWLCLVAYRRGWQTASCTDIWRKGIYFSAYGQPFPPKFFSCRFRDILRTLQGTNSQANEDGI